MRFQLDLRFVWDDGAEMRPDLTVGEILSMIEDHYKGLITEDLVSSETVVELSCIAQSLAK